VIYLFWLFWLFICCSIGYIALVICTFGLLYVGLFCWILRITFTGYLFLHCALDITLVGPCYCIAVTFYLFWIPFILVIHCILVDYTLHIAVVIALHSWLFDLVDYFTVWITVIFGSCVPLLGYLLLLLSRLVAGCCIYLFLHLVVVGWLLFVTCYFCCCCCCLNPANFFIVRFDWAILLCLLLLLLLLLIIHCRLDQLLTWAASIPPVIILRATIRDCRRLLPAYAKHTS